MKCIWIFTRLHTPLSSLRFRWLCSDGDSSSCHLEHPENAQKDTSPRMECCMWIYAKYGAEQKNGAEGKEWKEPQKTHVHTHTCTHTYTYTPTHTLPNNIRDRWYFFCDLWINSNSVTELPDLRHFPTNRLNTLCSVDPLHTHKHTHADPQILCVFFLLRLPPWLIFLPAVWFHFYFLLPPPQIHSRCVHQQSPFVLPGYKFFSTEIILK